MIMYYHIKCCLLVLVLSVIFQCREVSGSNMKANNQRDMMIEQLKAALKNDSDQLFTLQKLFLLPRSRDSQSTGICLKFKVFVTGAIDPDSYCQFYSCECVNNENNLKACIYTEEFELLPPAPRPLSGITLADFLVSHFIDDVLISLDVSFYTLMSVLSNSPVYNYYRDSENDYNYYYFMLPVAMDKFDALSIQSSIGYMISDALQVTLSWVS